MIFKHCSKDYENQRCYSLAMVMLESRSMKNPLVPKQEPIPEPILPSDPGDVPSQNAI